MGFFETSEEDEAHLLVLNLLDLIDKVAVNFLRDPDMADSGWLDSRLPIEPWELNVMIDVVRAIEGIAQIIEERLKYQLNLLN